MEHRYSNQVIGNTGLFYVCYELSKRGWNVLPTSRNAKGIDIIIYSDDAKLKKTIQVKALTKKHDTVNLGKREKINKNLIADYFIVCSHVDKDPCCYIMTKKEILSCVKEYDGELWAQAKARRGTKHGFEEFKDNWDRIYN